MPSRRQRCVAAALGAVMALLLAACGGGAGGEAPTIERFAADRPAYRIGDTAQLEVHFSGGSARIEPDLGPVRSGDVVATPALDGPRTYRLVVVGTSGLSVVRELALDVSYRDRWLSVPAPRVLNHASVGTRDGGVLLIGGSRLEGLPSAAIDRFDPFTRRFTRIGTLSSGRVDHSALRLPDGQVLVAGGTTAANVAPFAELVDERTGATRPAGTMVLPRHRHAAVVLADGRAMVIGGIGRNSAELWDPATGHWRLVAGRMAHARQHATATLLADGRVLVVGGDSDSAHYVFAELYDPRTETFTPLVSDIDERRALHAALRQSDGSVLVAGGEIVRPAYSPLATVWRFDPATHEWQAMAPLSAPRTLSAPLRLADGSLMMTGGQGERLDQALDSAEQWRPTQQRTLAPLPAPRIWHSTHRLADGRVLVIGGEDGQGRYHADALIYE